MKENHRQGKEPQPEMAAHPGFGPSHPPGANFFSWREQGGEGDQDCYNDPKSQARPTGSPRANGPPGAARDVMPIANRRRNKRCDREQSPGSMGAIDSHRIDLMKNSRGSTRMAASCGQA